MLFGEPFLIHKTQLTQRAAVNHLVVRTFHALCPAPTAGSRREAAHHVRMSCRLV